MGNDCHNDERERAKVVGPSTTSTRRPRNTVPLASGSSREAKRLAAVILEVFAGVRTLQQAAEALEMSLTALLPVGGTRHAGSARSVRAQAARPPGQPAA